MRYFRFKGEINHRHGYAAQPDVLTQPCIFWWVDLGQWQSTRIEGWNGIKLLELVAKGTWEELSAPPRPRGDWSFERSSGYAGWRCEKCAHWIYDGKPFVCDCDK